MAKKIKSIIFFLGLTIIILWQMLKPGYILTLDMIFTPHFSNFLTNNNIYNTYPFYCFLALLDLILPSWILQKIILLLLFLCISYLAFKFLPVPQNYRANYWAALFYTVNPFVYERFLAGHWQLLFAYAFLPPLIFYLLEFAKFQDRRHLIIILFWIFLIGMFSLHFWVISILLILIFLIFQILHSLIANKKEAAMRLLQYCCALGLGILILSSYWLIPYLVNNQKSILNTFTPENIQLFKSSGDPRLGTTLNVLSLYGFWQENQPWANYWLWPKDNFILWSIFSLSLSFLILTGLIKGLRNKRKRGLAVFFFIFGLLAFIFSTGLGETIFKGLNKWLFANIYFWRGFRDTNKFSAFLVISYIFFIGLGLETIIKFLKERNFKLTNFVLALIFLIPLIYTYPILGGFARQLQPIWYPKSWLQINQILNQDKSDYKVLFLPWHQYFSLRFNNTLITASPAKLYFDKKVIQSQNMELDSIITPIGASEYQKVENMIINENQFAENKIIETLQLENIKYIIWARDLEGQDIFQYNFLQSNHLWNTFNSLEINLYQIQGN
ncbi:MAG: hypothetical protein NTZ49_00055 [Candidatus Parcubacteria bacterium]|nr:hypothetical protein [Candidatus Parcubacteria bacterium]